MMDTHQQKQLCEAAKKKKSENINEILTRGHPLSTYAKSFEKTNSPEEAFQEFQRHI